MHSGKLFVEEVVEGGGCGFLGGNWEVKLVVEKGQIGGGWRILKTRGFEVLRWLVVAGESAWRWLAWKLDSDDGEWAGAGRDLPCCDFYSLFDDKNNVNGKQKLSGWYSGKNCRERMMAANK